MKMTPVTQEQGKDIQEYIENDLGVGDLDAELQRGDLAKQQLLPFVEHIIRMGAGGTTQKMFVGNVEYEVSITLKPLTEAVN